MRKEQGCKKKPGIPEKPGNLEIFKNTINFKPKITKKFRKYEIINLSYVNFLFT